MAQEDLLLAKSEDFWRMIRNPRSSGKSLPLAAVEARLGITGGKPGRKAQGAPRNRLSAHERAPR